MIPEIEIEEIKQNTNFLSLVADYGLSPIKKGGTTFINCPFHPEKTESLSIDPNKNLFHCFGCGEKGNPIQFVEKMEGLNFRDAVRRLQRTKTPLLNPSSLKPSISPKDRSTYLESAWKHFKKTFTTLPNGKKYLLSRGITTTENTGYCSSSFAEKLSEKDKENLKAIGLITEKGYPLFADCVVFALTDAQGKVLSLYGRKTSGQGSHYYLPGIREGLFYSKLNSSSVIVVESVIDAQSLINRGFKDVLALYGVNGYTKQHASFLDDYKVIHLLLDGDRTGREASHKLSKQLKEKGKLINQITLPNEEDPNSFLLKGEESTSWLKEQIERVAPKETSFSLTAEGDNYIARGDKLSYTLQGLSLTGLDKLRITFKVSLNIDPSLFHIDNIDLYNAKQRVKLAEGVATELGVKEDKVLGDLKSITLLLEKERLKAKEEQDTTIELSSIQREQAIEHLKSPDLVKNLLEDFEACGTIGEDKGKLLGFLGTISRFLARPLGVLIISRSGAGKTMLQESFCNMVPEEGLNQYTRISEKVLFYKGEEGLKNKVLAIEEEDGMDDAAYAIRTLQSNQKLTSSITRNDPKTGKMVADEYTVNGPVFIVISTTNPDALDYETRNRFVIVTIDESNEQTKRIIEGIKDSYTLEGMRKGALKEKVLSKYQNMQRVLQPLKVVNPYAKVLEYSCDRLQMRREFHKYMTLINTVTLFHQYQRETKHDDIGGSFIEVTPEDVAIANDLVLEFFPNSTDELAPHTRSFLEVLTEMVKQNEGEVYFTRRQAREFSTWSNYSMIKALDQLEELEYITKLTGRNGSVMRYELLVDATQSKRQEILLTDPKRLKELLKKGK